VIDNCIHLCLQLCANLAIFIAPFLPETAMKMCHMMKVVERMLQWENGGRNDLLKVNYPLREPQILFRKIEDAEVAAQVEKLRANGTKPATPAPDQQSASNRIQPHPTASNTIQQHPTASNAKPEISFDDFAKIELRAGTILSAEKVEKADKLLKLQIDLGSEVRTIVSGIAQHYKPEEIVGRQVTVVANLAPRKMRGIESAGMILMAEDADGKLVFVSPTEAVAAGSEVR
jgi:methionyl-tRNA synthetase